MIPEHIVFEMTKKYLYPKTPKRVRADAAFHRDSEECRTIAHLLLVYPSKC